MPSLATLLRDTMFVTAVDSNGFKDKGPVGKLIPAAPTPVSVDAEDRSSLGITRAEKNAIWRWTHDPAAIKEVSAVSCRARSMGYATMRVADVIRWSDVEIVAKDLLDRPTPYTLRLETKFLLRRSFLEKGTIAAGQSIFWPLFASVDASLLLVFGYKLLPGAVAPVPFDDSDDVDDDNFMPAPGGQSLGQPHRIVVCCELVCCKERADFDPQRLLGAARLQPHVLVCSSQPLGVVQSKTTLQRPARSTHEHADMDPEIRGTFFADTNRKTLNPLPPLPAWNDIFDYYDTVAPTGTNRKDFLVVSPTATRRDISSAVEEVATLGSTRKGITVTKVARQESFDNIHLAPAFISQRSAPFDAAAWQMERITMAPICQHDCLHTHWRWGERFDSDGRPELRGWSSSGKPYSVHGAPMVPKNQTVVATLIGPSTLEYDATAADVPAGQWQIFFHHGAAYSVSVRESESAIRAGLGGILGIDMTKSTFGGVYWALRFVGPSPALVPLAIPGVPPVVVPDFVAVPSELPNKPAKPLVERLHVTNMSALVKKPSASKKPPAPDEKFQIVWTGNLGAGASSMMTYGVGSARKPHVLLYRAADGLARGRKVILEPSGLVNVENSFDETWTTDWGAMTSFPGIAGDRYLLYKPGKGDVEFGNILPSGKLDEVAQRLWVTTDYAFFVPLEFQDVPFYFAYRPATDGVPGRSALGRINDGGTVEVSVRDVDTTWTMMIAYTLPNGGPHYIAYDAASGVAEFGRFSFAPNTPSLQRLSSFEWSGGATQWTAMAAFPVQGKPHYLTYRAMDANIDISSIAVDGKSDDIVGEPNLPLDKGAGFTHLSTFVLEGRNYALLYRSFDGSSMIAQLPS